MASIGNFLSTQKDPNHTTLGPKQVRPLKVNDSTADILAKMYNFMFKNRDDDKLKYELDKDFQEEREEEEQRRHDSLMKAIKEGSSVGEKKDDGKKGIWDHIKGILTTICDGISSILGFLKDSVFFVLKNGISTLALAIVAMRNGIVNSIEKWVNDLKGKFKNTIDQIKLPKKMTALLGYVAKAVPLLVGIVKKYLPILSALEAAPWLFDFLQSGREHRFARTSAANLVESEGSRIYGDDKRINYTITSPIDPGKEISVPLDAEQKKRLETQFGQLMNILDAIDSSNQDLVFERAKELQSSLTNDEKGKLRSQKAIENIRNKIKSFEKERDMVRDLIQGTIQDALKYKSSKFPTGDRGLSDEERNVMDARSFVNKSEDLIPSALSALEDLGFDNIDNESITPDTESLLSDIEFPRLDFHEMADNTNGITIPISLSEEDMFNDNSGSPNVLNTYSTNYGQIPNKNRRFESPPCRPTDNSIVNALQQQFCLP